MVGGECDGEEDAVVEVGHVLRELVHVGALGISNAPAVEMRHLHPTPPAQMHTQLDGWVDHGALSPWVGHLR